MAWDFETDPSFQHELDWISDFVRSEIQPLDHLIDHPMICGIQFANG
jgi:acyl-CoA dehydrogenase